MVEVIVDRGMDRSDPDYGVKPAFLLYVRTCMEKKGYRVSLEYDSKPANWINQSPYEKPSMFSFRDFAEPARYTEDQVRRLMCTRNPNWSFCH